MESKRSMFPNPTDPHQCAIYLLIQDTIDHVKAAGGDIVAVVEAAHLSVDRGLGVFQPTTHEEALKLFQQALSRLRGVPATGELVSCINSMTLNTLLLMGRNEEAIALRDEAFRGFEKDVRWTALLALCKMNLGAAYNNSGRPAEAIPYLERAIELYELVPNAAAQLKLCKDSLKTVRQNADRQNRRRWFWEKWFTK